MNWKSLFPFLVAIALGCTAVLLGKDFLVRRSIEVRPAQFTQAVVAAHDLEPGRQLQSQDLMLGSFPSESLPSSALARPEQITGRIVTIPIAKGQMVLDAWLGPEGATPGLPGLVPVGMRAVTIEVDEFHGMTGLIAPGCRVDILTTLVDEESRRVVSRTLVENVQVSAVGSRLAPKPPEEDLASRPPVKSVTLLVTPEQAEIIDLAAAKGHPRLVLRCHRDSQPAATPGVSLSQLIRGQTAPTPPPVIPSAPSVPAAAPRTIQVIRRGQVSTYAMTPAGDFEEVNSLHAEKPSTAAR